MNLTSRDIAIIKRKGMKPEGGKILSKKFFAKSTRILRSKEETRWTSISSETTSQYPKK